MKKRVFKRIEKATGAKVKVIFEARYNATDEYEIALVREGVGMLGYFYIVRAKKETDVATKDCWYVLDFQESPRMNCAAFDEIAKVVNRVLRKEDKR